MNHKTIIKRIENIIEQKIQKYSTNFFNNIDKTRNYVLLHHNKVIRLYIISDNASEDLLYYISMLKSLRYLRIGSLELEYLPTSLSNLKKLKYLDIFINNFTFFPEVIYELKKLEVLKITNGNIINIPYDKEFRFT